MKVYINKKIVEAEIIEERPKSFLVKLSDGHIIIRKKSRHVVKES
jgi:hypothetical protein